MMTQDEMSAAANWAITETRRLLPNGNSNPVEGIPGTMMRSSDPNQQALISAAVDEAYNTQNVGTSHLSSISCAAKIALGEKAGNCDQFASVAFALLFQSGVRPIYRAYYPGHAFVIIGNPPGPWVICDPWWDRCVVGPNPAYPNPQVIAARTTADPAGSIIEYNARTSNQGVSDRMDFSGGGKDHEDNRMDIG
jgi:hypothetical protein